MAMTTAHVIFVCILLGIQVAVARNIAKSDLVEVATSVGNIRGLRAHNGDYSMFLGIPYAEVNNTNPFGPAIPFPQFDDGFDAIDDSVICPQQEEANNSIVGDVNCLRMNIYVPNPVDSNNTLPVLIYIHGGLFLLGSGDMYMSGPKFLVRHGVILATINYRLGAYGFLNLDTPEAPGNQGLKDQLIAMKWLKQNIHHFGGNPDDFTVLGHSAGAMSIDYQLHSQSELLFNKAIMQSGSTLGSATTSKSGHKDQVLQISNHLGFTTNDIDEAFSFIANANALDVVKATLDLGILFFPTIENEFSGIERLVENYTIFLDVPKVKNVSILIGFTNGEYDTMYTGYSKQDFESVDAFGDTLRPLFMFNETYFELMKKNIQKFFIGDEALSPETRLDICDFASDLIFVYPVQRAIDKFMKNNVKSLYHYVFSYIGERNYIRDKNGLNSTRAFHSDESGYLFDIAYMDSENMTPNDQLIVDRMTTLWTNFAKYGDPTPTLTELLPEKWLPVTSDNTWAYTIDTKEVSMISAPFHKRKAFWDLFYMLNEQFQSEYFDI